MTEQNNVEKTAGRFASIDQAHWIAGLVVTMVLSFILAVLALGLTNQWAQLVVLSLFCVIIAGGVGFAVRYTSSVSRNQTFLAAFVTAALGVQVVVSIAGRGYDDFAWDLISAYSSAPLSGYAIFHGLVAGVVATVARRK